MDAARVCGQLEGAAPIRLLVALDGAAPHTQRLRTKLPSIVLAAILLALLSACHMPILMVVKVRGVRVGNLADNSSDEDVEPRPRHVVQPRLAQPLPAARGWRQRANQLMRRMIGQDVSSSSTSNGTNGLSLSEWQRRQQVTIGSDLQRILVTQMDKKLEQQMSDLKCSKRHAECSVCMEPLHAQQCVMFRLFSKRTCHHFFHEQCALALQDLRCPICRAPFDEVSQLPVVANDPDGWFREIRGDAEGLQQAQVQAVLAAQFAVDQSALERVMPELWERWDFDDSGEISRDEFVKEGGMLSFLREQLIH
eukprot:CAMPEP_0119347666 /NCGR_PEP_ID=MMETSP1333-20130426/108645_1 /TAXON_ID=418940 /ORGANISM="Scyphosphaera apsteinii, Strain RCC1455" /LENGTH=308 /DNA_ID=CAMNT_0007360223 /DNA_START=173 /DNA_END=1100 /DNA_ORIENTATION=-